MDIKQAQKAYLYDRLILYDGRPYKVYHIETWLDNTNHWQHSFALITPTGLTVANIKDCEVYDHEQD